MHYDIKNYNEIDSTSVWARKNLNNLPDFAVISAEKQTLGHGQFGRKWYSSDENGGNIYISMVLKPENIKHLNELTRYTSLKVAKTVVEYGLKPAFKYPNDILVNGQKIAGILAESVFTGNDFKGVIVGIGVNLNLSKEELLNIDIPATSLYVKTGKCTDKKDFLNRLLDNFKDGYEDFLESGLKEELVCQ